MQEKKLEIARLTAELESSLIHFKDVLADNPVSEGFNVYFRGMKRELTDLANAFEKDDLQKIAECANDFASSSRTLGLIAPELEIPEFQDAKNSLMLSAENLLAIVEVPPKPPKPLEPIEFESIFSKNWRQALPQSKADGSHNKNEKQHLGTKVRLTENELRLVSLEQELSSLETTAGIEITKLKIAYSEALSEIESKKTEIDNILGHVSGRAVAGDYEKSATEEKNKADWLRIGSLTCMALIAFSLGYSFWETIGTEFDWQKSLFRITLTFLLSVPAAYLARESAKHREQQYQHLQTSLDLKAISPFLASLPEEEQHKIKIAIASKLFAGRDFSKTSADPFPLNTQEIIMELLKRLDLSKVQASKD
ncbi:hypothetical protein M5G22_18005 [Pseudomonas sp. TNT2022 ID233]|uniref:hypothetical protein n=1 Tax=Pseudomonas aphyarum TaxID=2942629 RepID=UPI00235F5A90|nr:hypothetical protein [Pseudomonas aphyarum]MDD1139455.1 hypothetical protein [Pseudomonas aphyarum]